MRTKHVGGCGVAALFALHAPTSQTAAAARSHRPLSELSRGHRPQAAERDTGKDITARQNGIDAERKVVTDELVRVPVRASADRQGRRRKTHSGHSGHHRPEKAPTQLASPGAEGALGPFPPATLCRAR